MGVPGKNESKSATAIATLTSPGTSIETAGRDQSTRATKYPPICRMLVARKKTMPTFIIRKVTAVATSGPEARSHFSRNRRSRVKKRALYAPQTTKFQFAPCHKPQAKKMIQVQM